MPTTPPGTAFQPRRSQRTDDRGRRAEGRLLRTQRWPAHTSTPCPQRCAQGRFRGVDATHVPVAGPRSQQRRAYFRRSPEAVHGPNSFGRQPISGFLRKESRWEAPPSGFWPPPLAPGLFWFRARVILLPEGPTRPIPRLPVPGRVPTFPHPEPPLDSGDLLVVGSL